MLSKLISIYYKIFNSWTNLAGNPGKLISSVCGLQLHRKSWLHAKISGIFFFSFKKVVLISVGMSTFWNLLLRLLKVLLRWLSIWKNCIFLDGMELQIWNVQDSTVTTFHEKTKKSHVQRNKKLKRGLSNVLKIECVNFLLL